MWKSVRNQIPNSYFPFQLENMNTEIADIPFLKR